MPAEARDELYDYFTSGVSYTGNLAHQLEEEEIRVVQPKPEKKAAPVPKRVPLWKRVLLSCAALIVAGGLLHIAMTYSQLYTAKQELAFQEALLVAQQQNTAVMEEGVLENMTMAELYAYATGHLGMREAHNDEITQLGSLDTGYTVQAVQDAERQPTQIKFHLFGK